jgi:hypothetical protein
VSFWRFFPISIFVRTLQEALSGSSILVHMIGSTLAGFSGTTGGPGVNSDLIQFLFER